MEYFVTIFLCYTNDVKLVPPEVPVNIHKPTSFQVMVMVVKQKQKGFY